MNRVRVVVLSVVVVTVGLVLASSASADPPASSPGNAGFGISHHPVCGPAPLGAVRCHADEVDADAGKGGGRGGSVSGGPYGPADLRSAYGLSPTGSAGSGPTVAIVDAFDDPNALSHLLTYRQRFGLPLCADGGVSCILSKVDQRGGTTYPPANSGWAEEIDLDTQMVSAICPGCRILLVEADSNYLTDLGAAVNYAAGQGPVAISNSYGAGEFSGETAYETFYNHPGIEVTVSSGDSGYGVEFPAASRYVMAVGGTSLYKDAGGNWAEKAWSGGGSGCSAYIAQPNFQLSHAIGTCTNRMVADTSAVADPNTGVSVYTTGSVGTGWYVFGGTSVAAPVVASVHALAGSTIVYAERPYGSLGTSALRDVTSGSNGRCTTRFNTTNLALCAAVTGYDGPTGVGTPQGTAAF